MNVFQRINAVMKAVAYVQKDKAVTGMGAGYKAVTHDQLVAVVRQHLVTNGLAVVVSQTRGHFNDKGQKWDRDSKQLVPDNMRLYEGEYDVSVVNIEEPADRVTVHVEAHALDNGDKAPGKAMTYATKTAMLKLFWLETGEQDESRAPVVEEQVNTTAIMVEIATETDAARLAGKWAAWSEQCKNAQDVAAHKELKQAITDRLAALKGDKQ